MPKIAIFKNLIFYIVTYDLLERWHIHVAHKGRQNAAAKIWLDTCELFECGDLNEREISIAVKLIKKHHEEIENMLTNFASGIKQKTLHF